MNKPPLWTKNFLLNSIANFLIYLVYYLLMVIIATYAMDDLQATPSEAGLASGIFIVAGLVSRIFSGRLIDKVGRKKMIYVGLAVYSLATLLYFSANNLSVLLITRVLHGIGWGIATTTTATIVVNIIPTERRGEGISYFAMSVTMASAIGPFLGIYLYDHASFDAILVVSVVLLVIVCLAVYFLNVLEVTLTEEQLKNMQGLMLDNFIEVKALPISIIGAMVFFCYSSIISFLSAYTKEINQMDAGSLFFIVYSTAILISRPLTGRWFDEKGENFVMYPSFLLFAIGLVILSQTNQGVILLSAAIFLGFGFGTFSSCGQAIAIKKSPAHRMGLATSTFLAIAELGIGIGPFFLGLLIPIVGFRGLYINMAVVVILSMCLYHYLHGRKSMRGI
ncbi:Inner membrane transport protein YdhC [Sporomusa ovata DSM 2662]|uniref:Transporter n=1 Tax=Sporomusa ovata TaxID=2378 RepID=A0A0U1KZU7_9FIRM|nr:MFS transporter [Sporomusa ovata]EQB28684.1 major facilitator superfamily MFS_1 [Sporomusa ovata DSM 2662]CQR72194.1 transporter [Sporomusa ovata]